MKEALILPSTHQGLPSTEKIQATQISGAGEEKSWLYTTVQTNFYVLLPGGT